MVIGPDFNGQCLLDYPGYEDDFIYGRIVYEWVGNYWNITIIGQLHGKGEEFYKYTEEYFPYPETDGKYKGEIIESISYLVYLPS